MSTSATIVYSSECARSEKTSVDSARDDIRHVVSEVTPSDGSTTSGAVSDGVPSVSDASISDDTPATVGRVGTSSRPQVSWCDISASVIETGVDCDSDDDDDDDEALFWGMSESFARLARFIPTEPLTSASRRRSRRRGQKKNKSKYTDLGAVVASYSSHEIAVGTLVPGAVQNENIDKSNSEFCTTGVFAAKIQGARESSPQDDIIFSLGLAKTPEDVARQARSAEATVSPSSVVGSSGRCLATASTCASSCRGVTNRTAQVAVGASPTGCDASTRQPPSKNINVHIPTSPSSCVQGFPSVGSLLGSPCCSRPATNPAAWAANPARATDSALSWDASTRPTPQPLDISYPIPTSMGSPVSCDGVFGTLPAATGTVEWICPLVSPCWSPAGTPEADALRKLCQVSGSLSGQELAAQLRAFAPESYED